MSRFFMNGCRGAKNDLTLFRPLLIVMDQEAEAEAYRRGSLNFNDFRCFIIKSLSRVLSKVSRHFVVEGNSLEHSWKASLPIV